MRTSLIAIAAAIGLAATATPAFAQPKPRPPMVLAPGQNLSGELSPLDTQRRSGKFEDVYRLEGRRGERVEIELSSDDFDPYLLVNGPNGFAVANDDKAKEQRGSRLTIELPTDGVYRVSVTSFEASAMGAYRIAARPAAADAALDKVLPSSPIQLGAAISGRLEGSDTAAGGEGAVQDRYRLTARRGERVRIGVSSDDFDPVVRLQLPDGTILANDDHGESTDSRIETVLADDGDYVISVSAYGDEPTGAYRLAVEPQAGNPRHADLRGGARVIAVAVGVSDYARISGLPHTDKDARSLVGELRKAGLLHPASTLLTNGQATKEAVRAAIAKAASAAGPDDLVMFFFSGHGDQVDVKADARELDGRAETLELYDLALRDSELETLLAGVNSRMLLVAIDACFSGGFRNLVNRPNVIGLFSSEEDMTSLVADPLEAGGYLSHYLRLGLAGEADNDGDKVITSGELATYLRRRFRLQGDIPAATREDEANYQHLLVERGGVHIEEGIVRLGGDNQVAQAAESRVRRAGNLAGGSRVQRARGVRADGKEQGSGAAGH